MMGRALADWPACAGRGLGHPAGCGGPVGAENAVALCDLRIFVDHAAEPVPAQNAHTGRFDRRCARPAGGSCCSDRCGRCELQ